MHQQYLPFTTKTTVLYHFWLFGFGMNKESSSWIYIYIYSVILTYFILFHRNKIEAFKETAEQGDGTSEEFWETCSQGHLRLCLKHNAVKAFTVSWQICF